MLRGTGVGCRWSNPPPNTDFNTPLTVPKKGVVNWDRQKIASAFFVVPFTYIQVFSTSHMVTCHIAQQPAAAAADSVKSTTRRSALGDG